jgi:mRNA interferase HigB
MRIISWNVLAAYAGAHPETKAALLRWKMLVRSADWSTMDEVRRASPGAKILNGERVRFEIAGGSFRMIAAFDFARHIVFIKFIGTHAEYERIDALNVSLF